MSERDDKGKFQKGVSGNPSGRKKGAGGKLSDVKLAEMLSRRTKSAIDTVVEIMLKTDNENVKLRAALAVVAQDKSMRDFLYKKAIDAKRLALAAQGKEPEQPVEDEEVNNFSVISLKAVDND